MAQLKDLLVSGAARFLNGLNINGDIKLAGNLLPASNKIYNLGNTTYRWKQIQAEYLSVDAGDISSSNYKLYVSGDSYLKGNTTIGENASNSNQTLTINGHTVINPSYNANNSYSEGLRINKDTNNWSVIALGGDVGTVSGTSAKTWLIGDYDGTLFLSVNGSDSAATRFQGNANGFIAYPRLGVNGENTSYNFYVNGTSYHTDSISIAENKLALRFRGEDTIYHSGIMYQTAGNEALVFANQNSVTSFMFLTGTNPASMNSATWQSATPALQIKQNSVYINQRINQDVTPAYNFYVNGTSYFNGVLFAKYDVDMISHGNEFNVVPTLSGDMQFHFNYRQTNGNNTNGYKITQYSFCDGNGAILASITNGTFHGTATSASKLTTNAGSATQPIYFLNGVPVATSYSLAKSVPSNAVFTDVNVTQTVTDTNATYPLLLAPSGQTATTTTSSYFDSGVTLNPSTNTITANITGSAASATNATNSSKLYVNTTSADTNYYILGATGTGNQSVYRALNSSGTANTTGVYFNGVTGVLFGAAWNDYAEFRQSDEIEAGRVVCETGKGDLILSTERLQPGAEIISDTFGFAIGETKQCKTPIAASGRVLAYTFEDRYEFKAGDAVCAGPNGTVSKMTREEIINYPDRIIGTVSEIPEYDTWGQNNIKVNNRIWIRIR